MGLVIIGEVGAENPRDEPALGTLLGLEPSKPNLRVFPQEQKGRWLDHPEFPGASSKKGQAVSFWHVVAYSGQPEAATPLFSLNASSDVSAGYTRRLEAGRVIVIPCMAVYADGRFWDPIAFLGDDNTVWGDALQWVTGK